MLQDILHAVRPLLAPAFTAWGNPVSWLEIVGAVLGVLMVVANWRVNPVAWPLAITSSLLYLLVFAHTAIYGQAALQIVFIALAAWGWWQWRRGTGHQVLRVRSMTVGQRAAAAAATLAGWPLLGLLLQHSTDSRVPFLDALPTAASLTAVVLLGRKFVENWPVWVFVNAVSVVLFASQSLWPTTLLYLLFAVMALVGWRAWQRIEAHG